MCGGGAIRTLLKTRISGPAVAHGQTNPNWHPVSPRVTVVHVAKSPGLCAGRPEGGHVTSRPQRRKRVRVLRYLVAAGAP